MDEHIPEDLISLMKMQQSIVTTVTHLLKWEWKPPKTRTPPTTAGYYTTVTSCNSILEHYMQ